MLVRHRRRGCTHRKTRIIARNRAFRHTSRHFDLSGHDIRTDAAVVRFTVAVRVALAQAASRYGFSARHGVSRPGSRHDPSRIRAAAGRSRAIVDRGDRTAESTATAAGATTFGAIDRRLTHGLACLFVEKPCSPVGLARRPKCGRARDAPWEHDFQHRVGRRNRRPSPVMALTSGTKGLTRPPNPPPRCATPQRPRRPRAPKTSGQAGSWPGRRR